MHSFSDLHQLTLKLEMGNGWVQTLSTLVILCSVSQNMVWAKCLGKDLAMAPGSQAFPFPFPITVPAIFHPLPANTLADLALFSGMSAICSCGLGPGPW